MSEASVPVPAGDSSGTQGWGAAGAQPDPRRWLILVVIGIAQLMVVLDVTVMNLALPSAQKALHFSDAGGTGRSRDSRGRDPGRRRRPVA